MLKRGWTIRSRKLYTLTVGGAVTFWVTTIATSLLPIAAQYRAYFANWKLQTVWVDSLLAGLIIAGCVSCALLSIIEKHPARNPIQQSEGLSIIALVIAIVFIDVPQSFLQPGSGDDLYYFLVGVVFNAARFVGLGWVVGYLCKRL